MKSFLMAFIFLSAVAVSAQSQAVSFIEEALQLIEQKDYQMAQLSLQDAINDLNNLIAGQIADALPDEINGLSSTGDADISNASMGMLGGGMQIAKSYSNSAKPENMAEIQILANSPLLTSINMYLTNPSMLGPEYKSVRVGNIRAILKTEMEEYYDDKNQTKEIRSSELQIPLTRTLITINLHGFASEADELSFANKLDIPKLKPLLSE